MTPRPAAGTAGAAVASPCVNICRMEGGLCVGCLRTLDEITRWAGVDDDGKRLILAAVAQRRGEAGKARSDAAA